MKRDSTIFWVTPDEAVAIGAAYHVLDVIKNNINELENKDEVEIDIPKASKTYNFQDVTSHGIGVVILDDDGNETNSVILPKNTQVPALYKEYYSTMVPYQEKLLIQVTQGEEEDLRYVTVIGTAEINISPREELVDIEVSISCDENSIIHVRVYDMGLDEDLGEMHIDRVSNLSEDEIKNNQYRIGKLDISGE